MSFYTLRSKLQKPLFSLIIIFVFLLIANKPLLNDVVYESDDYKHHATRIANYYLALKQGQLPVRWGPNLNQSYGYPSFNYIYHTPYILASVIHSVDFSIQESLNLSVLFAILFSSLTCYLFVSSYRLEEKWKIVLSLLYIINPYTLLNIYWRGAIGELFFFSLTPLFLLGIKKIVQQKEIKNTLYWGLLISFSTALLILSHLPSLFLLGILTIFFIFTEVAEKHVLKKSMIILFTGGLGLLLSAWYWVPAYFEQWMVTYEKGTSFSQYETQFVSLTSIFDVTKSALSDAYFIPVLQIGVISLFALISGLFLLRFKKELFVWYGLTVLAFYFSSSHSLFFWDSIVFLKYIQYPWRFLWFVTFAVIMILIHFFLEKKIPKLYKNMSILLITVGLVFTVQSYIKIKGTTKRSDFDWYHPVTDTGSSFDEHQPIWSQIPYYFPSELSYLVASESALLTKETVVNHVYQLSDLGPTIAQFDGKTISYTITPHEDIIAVHKRLFYPGWEARINGVKASFIESVPEYSGVLAIAIPANQESTVSISFTGYTKLRRVSEILSVITLISITLYCLLKKLWQNS